MSGSDQIGARVRSRRVELGIKQAQLAQSVGISAAYLNLIEHDRRRIRPDLLDGLSVALDIPVQILTEGADTDIVDGVVDAATAVAMPMTPKQARVIAERAPDGANLILKQHARIQGVETTLANLSDRLAHDPFFADTVHEIVSTASAIQATSAILVDGAGMDPQLERRFRENIHADSLRLSGATKGLSDVLASDPDATSEALSPHDAVFAVLARHDFYLPALEKTDISLPECVKAVFGDLTPDAQSIAAQVLEHMYRLARLLPLDVMNAALDRHGLDPEILAQSLDVDFATLFRRLAAMPASQTFPKVGLVVVDPAGRVLHRQTCDGFDIPRAGTVCALWPVFVALQMPHVPQFDSLSQIRRAAAGARRDKIVQTFTTTERIGRASLGRPALNAAVMLVVPQSDQEVEGRPIKVGTACRVCQHSQCFARGEPSILSDGF